MAQIENTPLKTNTGHPLSQKEELFIQAIVQGKSNSDAVREAGYETTAPAQFASEVLKKFYISEEIKHRLDLMNQDSIEAGKRLYEFWWNIVDGKTKDAFGLEADLSTRIKASQELAKRLIDIPNKGEKTPEIKITLDWGDK